LAHSELRGLKKVESTKEQFIGDGYYSNVEAYIVVSKGVSLMTLTIKIVAALQGDNQVEHYNQLLQLRQQFSTQEIEQAATRLVPENREKLRQLLQQMFDDFQNCEDMILALKLLPVHSLEDWLQEHFGKQQPELLTSNELLKAQQLITESEELTSSTLPEVSSSIDVTSGEIRTINLSQIRLDGGTQPRVEADDGTICAYQQDLEDGTQFPPVVVFCDGHNYWLADGFHRFYAYQCAKRVTIEAKIWQGTRRDAILYSVGANATHGLRRNNADKRRAVMTLLHDSEWSKWSVRGAWTCPYRQIAQQCGVSNRFVSNLRKEVSVNSTQIDVENSPNSENLSVNSTQIDVENSPNSENLSVNGTQIDAENLPNSNLSVNGIQEEILPPEADQTRKVIRNGKTYTMRTAGINQERSHQHEDDDSSCLPRHQQPQSIAQSQCAIFTYDCNNDPEAIAKTLKRQLSTRGKFSAVVEAMVELLETQSH
jgi:hypothetical protein